MLDIYIYADATHFYAFSYSFGQIVIHPFWQRDILENKTEYAVSASRRRAHWQNWHYYQQFQDYKKRAWQHF